MRSNYTLSSRAINVLLADSVAQQLASQSVEGLSAVKYSEPRGDDQRV